MQITIKGEDVGKKFGKNWIFRHLDFEIKKGETTAIVGKNGAGKSTLLQIIAGFLTPSSGFITIDGLTTDDSKASINLIGPYTELIEEFTLRELLSFHSQFKKPSCSFEEMAESASLNLHKPILDFSTGMKQRAKLLTCFFFEDDILFMDEPTSNLDEEGLNWWMSSIEKLKTERLILIASNQKEEIGICNKIIQLSQ
jgi:ABC-type multidrug transport system ATPase subunit